MLEGNESRTILTASPSCLSPSNKMIHIKPPPDIPVFTWVVGEGVSDIRVRLLVFLDHWGHGVAGSSKRRMDMRHKLRVIATPGVVLVVQVEPLSTVGRLTQREGMEAAIGLSLLSQQLLLEFMPRVRPRHVRYERAGLRVVAR